MPYPGEILSGLYQIEDEIGKGGMGIIYRARHLNLQKYVVVKKIKEHYVGTLNVRGEVDILKALHHTSLPQVYDFIQIGNEVYTVMDYIEGHDLQYYIDRSCRFEEQTLWIWLMQLCDVLDYLHKHGILHLDIKPANIMLTEEGNICLIDFNVSLSDEEETMTGISQIYAAPEQYRKYEGLLYHTADGAIRLDQRTDLYSLGATFYRMMTGCQPSPIPMQMYPIESFQLPCSDELIRIIARMLRPEPAKRYSSAARVLTEINRTQRTRAEKNTLRMVFGLMMLALVIVGIVFGIVLYRSQGYVSSEERKQIAAEELLLSEWNAAGEFEEAYGEGVAFLNQEADLLDRLDGARQSILEQLLESCLGMEDYTAATDYLNELLATGQKAQYYEAAAVIAANHGDYEAAEQYIADAQEAGGSARELEKSRAELYAAQGAYDSAIAIYQELYEQSQENGVLRRMAALNLKAGMAESSEIAAASYLTAAVEYYEELYRSGLSTYTDQMNLTSAYVSCGWSEKAVSLLLAMSVDYPDRYEVFRDLAILKYNAEMKKPSASRDFTQVKSYAKQAAQLYSSDTSGENDEQLESLLSIVETLP